MESPYYEKEFKDTKQESFNREEFDKIYRPFKTAEPKDRGFLFFNIINIIIVCVFIFFDIILRNDYNFLKNIELYLDRIILFLISLGLLISYQKLSKLARIIKLIILIINLVIGITLRAIYISSNSEDSLLIYRIILSLIQIAMNLILSFLRI